MENLTLDITKGYNTYAVGGIAAVLFNEANITDCSVKGLNVTKAEQVGGMVGSFVKGTGNAQLLIKDCGIMDTKLADTSSFGGMVCVTNGFSKIENCNVNNIEGVCKWYAGGIAGNLITHTESESIVSKCVVNNLNIKGGDNASGIVGYSDNVNVSDCIVSNSRIENGNTGGISGFVAKGIITRCITKNVDLINTQGKVGGITGGTNLAVIDDCQVYGGSITSTSEYKFVGGICGLGTNVLNCTVENLTINAESTSGVGGIIGNGKNEVSTSLIQNCSVKNCKIKGKNYVGGIAGAASINISNCQVEGSILEGTDGVGGIQGFGGEFTDATKYVPVKIDKGEVTNTEIKGTTNVNNIQGCNTYVKDSTDPTKDTITNCKYNGSAVTQ